MLKSTPDDLPPELIALFPSSLPTASLNALALTCLRLHEILQPQLESRITPELGHELLCWAATSKPHIVLKLLSPPHSIKLTGDDFNKTKRPSTSRPKPGTPTLRRSSKRVRIRRRGGISKMGPVVRRHNLDVVQLLLDKGANASVTVPLFALLDGVRRFRTTTSCTSPWICRTP
ncbi:hypothetical protein C8R44DRAFT_876615 [Mycena epipterygia]|nr:hypothetical protein C8R44DRAFT_876615 [Mycena epipterygia]